MEGTQLGELLGRQLVRRYIPQKELTVTVTFLAIVTKETHT
jgi:hypothetical protein